MHRLCNLSGKAYRILMVIAMFVITVPCAGFGVPVQIFTAIWFVVTLLPLAVAFLKPVYYRCVPGRLDILQFGWFRTTNAVGESIDLRTAEIVCRCHEQRLIIRDPNANSPERVIDLYGVQEPKTLVRGIFQAAISQFQSPNIPGDALLG